MFFYSGMTASQKMPRWGRWVRPSGSAAARVRDGESMLVRVRGAVFRPALGRRNRQAKPPAPPEGPAATHQNVNLVPSWNCRSRVRFVPVDWIVWKSVLGNSTVLGVFKCFVLILVVFV